MRPFITVVIATLLLSGIFVYTRFADRVRPERVDYVADFSEFRYSVRLNRTFDCAGNSEFGLNSSLTILFKEATVLERTDAIKAAEPIQVELPGVEIGNNSIFVEAQLPSQLDAFADPGFDSFSTRSHAMQIEVLREGNVIKEQTFWIEPGLNSVSGSVHFEIKEAPKETAH